VDATTPFWTAYVEHVEKEPHRPALTCRGETLTRAELHDRALALAHQLRDQGVTQGSYVSVVLPNSLDFVVSCFAAWALGAVPQPLSGKLPPLELQAILDLTQPAAVIDGDTVFPAPGGFASLPEATSPSWKAPTSGGSSGRPKVIVAGSPGVYGVAEGFGGLLGIDGESPLLTTAPLSHNGPFMMCHLNLVLGGHSVLMPKFDAAEALRLIQDHKVGWVYAVPTMMSRMWKLPDRASYDVSSVKTLMHMAAPCPPQLKADFIEWFGADVVMELYAGTEAQAATVLSGREWLEHRGSVGKVVLGSMEVRDEDGRPVPVGTVGKVWMRMPEGQSTYRYVGATAETDGSGWETLGDLGRFDADGYLYLADRESDMILVGGSNVYPAEIEAALLEHPDVDDACVVGLPDEDKGNVPHAIVRYRGDARPDLSAFLAERLAAYKLPKTFEVVDEPLRDAAGKVRRAQLRAERLPS